MSTFPHTYTVEVRTQPGGRGAPGRAACACGASLIPHPNLEVGHTWTDTTDDCMLALRAFVDSLPRTVVRDAENLRDLNERGWRVLVIWECGTRDIAGLTQQIKEFLHEGHA